MFVCCCADPDCLARGCRRLRDMVEPRPAIVPILPPATPFGWTCPVCQRGVAPGVTTCDHGHPTVMPVIS
jgi:hypothetical protein